LLDGRLLAYGFLWAERGAGHRQSRSASSTSTTGPISSVLWVDHAGWAAVPNLSATNPLLQSGTLMAHRERTDWSKTPYLCLLSNFDHCGTGVSVAGGTNFSLRTQTLAWSIAFLMFVMVCGVIA
jgi:hypothetical protein